jgi:Fic family protein
MTQQKTKNPATRRNRKNAFSKRLVRQHRFEQLETRNLLAADFLENFDGYAGAGFQPEGGAGRLDSSVWSAAMGTTSVNFGGTSTADALSRGIADWCCE